MGRVAPLLLILCCCIAIRVCGLPGVHVRVFRSSSNSFRIDWHPVGLPSSFHYLKRAHILLNRNGEHTGEVLRSCAYYHICLSRKCVVRSALTGHHAHVGDLRSEGPVSVGMDEQVRRLEIVVNETLAVQIFQSLEELDCQPESMPGHGAGVIRGVRVLRKCLGAI